MKEKAGQGIGIVVNKANLITKEQENYLWEKWVFGQREWGAALLYFGLGVWHSVCSEGWAGTQEFEV